MPKRTTAHRTAKGAQAAHEAIRPTDVNRTPQNLRASITADEAKLYGLIWNRAVASQCCSARLRKTRIVSQSGDAFWEANGQVVEFAGYTRYWNNLKQDTQLPTLQEEQSLTVQQAQADAKQTQPPPRYSEPKLVRLMEKQGIGRPSTYAPTIKTLQARNYVQLMKGTLQPTGLGLELDAALENLLPDLIQPEFTAQMESSLDAIASGQTNWQAYLTEWNHNYFAPAIQQAKETICKGEIMYTPDILSIPAQAQRVQTTRSSSSIPRRVSLENTLVSQTHSAISKASKKTEKTIACPKCGDTMNKVPSRSKKLKAKHFLKCGTPGCGTVMFWNSTKKTYELPYAQRTADPEAFTDMPCPVCGALLERYHYSKEGQQKVMLRCSLLENRRSKCKEVAFFKGRDGFWSPKFGVLKGISIN